MKQILFHIGYHKCGSTLLQRQLFKRHPQIKYVSRRHYAHEILNCNALDRDYTIFDRHIENTFLNNIVFSCEEFLGNFHNGGLNGNFTKLFLTELVDTYPESKFLIVIRNHKDLISSIYGQYIKEGGSLSEKRFLFNNMREFRYRGPGFCFDLFKYARIIEFMLSIVPVENLKVILFEDLVEDYEHVTTDICQFINVEPDVSISQRMENEALSRKGLQIMKFLNLFCEGDVLQGEKMFNLKKQRTNKNARLSRLRYISFLDRVILKKLSSKYKLKKETQQFIDEYFAGDNVILENLLSRQLTSKGYYNNGYE